MEEVFAQLLSAYGNNECVADALGYSERQYRNIRRKVKNGEALPARTVEFIKLKLQQLHSKHGCAGESHALR